jgi:hypothetical protein
MFVPVCDPAISGQADGAQGRDVMETKSAAIHRKMPASTRQLPITGSAHKTAVVGDSSLTSSGTAPAGSTPAIPPPDCASTGTASAASTAVASASCTCIPSTFRSDMALAPCRPMLAYCAAIIPEQETGREPVEAILIAQGLGMPLKIAAKVDPFDEGYFRKVVEPLLAPPGIEFIGEINDKEKGAFLGEASAVLFPVCWPEPFGMVMIEGMACGTPVLAFRCGSADEVIDHGLTGVVVDNLDQAVVAVRQTMSLDRRKVRRQFEEPFLVRRMAKDYVRVACKPCTLSRTSVRGFAWLRGTSRPALLTSPVRGANNC